MGVNIKSLILSKKYTDETVKNNKTPIVQSDWEDDNTNSDAYIRNKPKSLPASDVYEWAKESKKPTYCKDEIGLESVDNTSDNEKPVSILQQEALNDCYNRSINYTDQSIENFTKNKIEVSGSLIPNGGVPFVGNDHYIVYPSGGCYISTSTQTFTGHLTITLPSSWDSTMLKFSVSIFNYVTGESVDYHISGYNFAGAGSQNPGWHGCTAVCVGKAGKPLSNLPVKFCHNSERCVIIIGEDTTSWSYAQAIVHDILIGRNKVYDKWKLGWNVTIDTSSPTVYVTITDTHVTNGSADETAKILSGWADTRDIATKPEDYFGKMKPVGIKRSSITGIQDGAYATLLGIGGWTDFTGGAIHELAFNGNGSMYRRFGNSAGSWSSWREFLDSGNYSRFVFPITGGVVNGYVSARSKGINWIEGKTLSNSTFSASNQPNNDGWYPILSSKTKSGNVWNLGTIADDLRFVGFKAATTIGNPDWQILIDTNTGRFTSDAIIEAKNFYGGKATFYGQYKENAGVRYNNGGLEIRENGLVTNTQSDIGYAPSIGFHWGGRIAASLLFHSDGNFYFKKGDGVTRATVDADLRGYATLSGATINGKLLLSTDQAIQWFSNSGPLIGAFRAKGDNGQICFYPDGWSTSATLTSGIILGRVSSNNNLYFMPRTSNTYELGSSGNMWKQIYSNNSTISTSDERLKNNIQSLDFDLTKRFIMGLNPIQYTMKDGDSGRTHYGLGAQSVEQLMKSLNMTSIDFAGFIKSPKIEIIEGEKSKTTDCKIIENEYIYGLRYEEFIAPLIKMVQIQQLELERLKIEVENLKS